jgi:hypothetical protein
MISGTGNLHLMQLSNFEFPEDCCRKSYTSFLTGGVGEGNFACVVDIFLLVCITFDTGDAHKTVLDKFCRSWCRTSCTILAGVQEFLSKLTAFIVQIFIKISTVDLHTLLLSSCDCVKIGVG